MHKSLALMGAIGFVVAASSATAAGPGPFGTNDCTTTNYYAYSNYYQNHYLYTNGTGWYTNMARWSNAPAPGNYQNRHQTVSQQGGPAVTPPGPRPNAGGTPTPADVQALVQQFQQDRDAFMVKQRALEQQLSGASEQDRLQIRDQLKDQMEQWKQQQTRVHEQLQDQCDRLRDQLRDHTRLMDRISNPGTGSGGTDGNRPRGRQ